MSSVSKISSGAAVVPLVRRLPEPDAGVDINFCRKPACALYGVPPDPFQRPNGTPPAPPGVPRGVVSGKMQEEYYKCPACGATSRLKNNIAVVEERERMRLPRTTDPCAPACHTVGCAHQDLPGNRLPISTSASARPRAAIRAGAARDAQGPSHPASQRDGTSGPTRTVSCSTCSAMTCLAKVSKISGLSYRDIYRRIGFYHDQVRSFVARREDFSRIDFAEAGSRFATDSQALTNNWPSRKRRFPVVFQHLCTAHACSGFIMEASFQLDPDISPAEAEAQAVRPTRISCLRPSGGTHASGRRPSSTLTSPGSPRLRGCPRLRNAVCQPPARCCATTSCRWHTRCDCAII